VLYRLHNWILILSDDFLIFSKRLGMLFEFVFYLCCILTINSVFAIIKYYGIHNC
jgi:hypothetical protein